MSASRAPHDLPDALRANREDLRRRARAERVRPVWLWIGILTGPVAFLAVRIVSIVLVTHGCSQAAAGSGPFGLSSSGMVTAGVTVVGALLTIGAGLMSWSIWRKTSLSEDEVSVEHMPRVPFWALGGMLLAAFFLLSIVITGGTALLVSTSCPPG